MEYYIRRIPQMWEKKEELHMAYYCGECAVWRGSSDENRYGERWCAYSRRYEKADQNSYGCRGFVDGSRRYFHVMPFEEYFMLRREMEEGSV